MKKYVRNVVAITLTCAMILPLAACNKGKKKGKQKKVAEDDPYFTATEVVIDLEVDKSKKLSYKDIYEPHLVGDKLICTYNIQYEMPEDMEQQITDMYMNMKEGEEEEIYQKIEEMYAPYSEFGLVFFDLEGNVLKKTQFDMTASLNGLTPLEEGGFMAVNSNYDMGECKQTLSLQYLDDDGNITKEIPLDSQIEDLWGGKVFTLDNGNFLISSYSGVFVVDKNGKLLGKDSSENMMGDIYKVDNKYYAFLYEYDDAAQKEKCTLNEIDLNTGAISKDGKEVSSMIWNAVPAGDGFYYCGSNGISKLDIFDKKSDPELLLDWNWTDLNRSSIQPDSLNVISDDEIMFLKMKYETSDDPSVKYSGSTLSLVTLKREKKNPHAGKTIIMMGAAGMYSDKFMDYIVSYNTDENNKSRITFKDYAENLYNEEDYEKASKEMADKVYLEMLAGEGPDILLNFSAYSQFNNDEVLVDLNTFIDGENGFNRDDYFDNVLRAFEVKGKMYQIPVCVDIHGFVANRDYVGDRTSWTYEEFMSVADSLPEDVSLMEEISCADLLGNLISVSSDTYIDYEKKTVNFDCDDFRKALEIAKKYGTLHPSGEDNIGGYVDDFGEYHYVDPMEKINNGMQAMTSAYMYSLRQYAEYVSGLKDKTVFLGAPSPKSSGLSAQPMLTLAIAKSCADQEEAWDLIRFMYNKEQQIEYANDFYSVPLLREALDEKTKKDIEQFEQEKAEMEQWGDTEYLEMYYNFDMNEDMAEDFIKIIEGVSTITSTDAGIMMIVNEEAPGYFEGQRSADDVCKNIQNRATTLLNER